MRQENNKVLMRSWVVGQQGKVKVINQMKTCGQYNAIGHASDRHEPHVHPYEVSSQNDLFFEVASVLKLKASLARNQPVTFYLHSYFLSLSAHGRPFLFYPLCLSSLSVYAVQDREEMERQHLLTKAAPRAMETTSYWKHASTD